MSGGTCVILGAGFSRWSAGLPVVGGLFDLDITPLNDRESKRLRSIEELKQRWDVAHPGGNNEQFVADILSAEKPRARLHVLWYLTRRLSEPFVATITRGFQTLMIDDSRKMRLPGIVKAADFFGRVDSSSLTGIVTPNWDLLAEYALGTSGFNYGMVGEILEGRGKNHVFPWQGARPSLTGRVAIAKIHGSLSWADGVHYTDGRCGLRGKADIIPPVPEKTMDARLANVWDLARNILGVSRDVIVFGFAFNPYDEALLGLLATGQQVRRVLLVDPMPQVERAQRVWPEAKVSTCSPPGSHWGKLTAWL